MGKSRRGGGDFSPLVSDRNGGPKQILQKILEQRGDRISREDRQALERVGLITYPSEARTELGWMYYTALCEADSAFVPSLPFASAPSLASSARASTRLEFFGRSEVLLDCDSLFENLLLATRRSAPPPAPRDSPWSLDALQFRDLTPEDYELLLKLDDRVEKKTVPKAKIESFPTAVFTAPCQSDSCRVCMVEYSQGDELRQLPCGHRFHADCIATWLTGSSVNCPIDGLPVV